MQSFKMENKTIKIMLLLLLVVTASSFVFAQQVYEEDSVVNLKVPCFNNNSYCSGASTCNLTIIDFDGETIIDNEAMTYNAAYHNYTLNETHTEESGEYRASVICNDAGTLGHATFEFIITPTGNASDTSSAIIQGLILVLMFGVTIFFLIFAGTTDVAGVKLFFNVISYLTMTLTVGTGYILLQNSGVQSNMSTTMNGMLYIVSIVLIVIMFYIFINQTRQALELMKIRKGYGSEFDNPPIF